VSETIVDDRVVVFDYPRWMAKFPEFSAVVQPRAEWFFQQAEMLCQNDARSLVYELPQRAIYLDLLTAHIAALSGGLTPCGTVAAGAGVGMVGRITSASEGSVSISSEYNTGTDTPGSAWYNQTPYGAMYWNMTAQFRTWRYFIGPRALPSYLPIGTPLWHS